MYPHNVYVSCNNNKINTRNKTYTNWIVYQVFPWKIIYTLKRKDEVRRNVEEKYKEKHCNKEKHGNLSCQ